MNGKAGISEAAPSAVARQRSAAEISGWGSPFRFVQPHNLNFWVYVALTAVGLTQIWSYFHGTLAFYAEPFAVAAVLCLLCGIAWAAWFHHIDRWERQPGRLIAAALVWGAIPATFAFAMPVNSALLGIYPKLFGQDWASNWAAGLTAPFTEEAAKLCGLVLLLGFAPRLIRTANDGLIVGAFIGLGFAVFEDFLYAANGTMAALSLNPDSAAVSISITRIATSAVSHPLFSALVCSGFMYLIGTAAQPRRILRGVLFVLAGMFLHFTWDDASGLGGGNGLGVMAVLAASVVLALVILAFAFKLAAPPEHEFVRDLLAPEVEVGTLSADELAALIDRRARKTWLRQAQNHRERKARRHLRHALFDLCHAIAGDYNSEGQSRTEHARAEVDRLRDRANNA